MIASDEGLEEQSGAEWLTYNISDADAAPAEDSTAPPPPIPCDVDLYPEAYSLNPIVLI